MEEMEDPTERLQEELQEHAHEHGEGAGHAGGHAPGPAAREPWVGWAALTAAILAALAAVTTMLSGHNANEALMEQSEAHNKWAYYQAKGVDSRIVQAEDDYFSAFGKPVPAEHSAKIKEWDHKRKEAEEEAREKEASSRAHLKHHVRLSYGVTLFQVSIAVAAISVLTRRAAFWWVSMVFGGIGVCCLVWGLLPASG